MVEAGLHEENFGFCQWTLSPNQMEEALFLQLRGNSVAQQGRSEPLTKWLVLWAEGGCCVCGPNMQVSAVQVCAGW